MLEIRHISDYQRLGILDLERFSQGTNHSKREAEKAATLYTINGLLSGSPFELTYTAFNKPFLAGRTERISISHSHGLLVVMVNDREETGVDIELCRDKVLAIRHKFLNAQESRFAGEDIESLITIWAAKEALYKLYGMKNLDFRENLAVEYLGNELLKGTVHKEGQRNFLLKRERIRSHVLVYVLNEVQPVSQKA